jgi:hypothetical protein
VSTSAINFTSDRALVASLATLSPEDEAAIRAEVAEYNAMQAAKKFTKKKPKVATVGKPMMALAPIVPHVDKVAAQATATVSAWRASLAEAAEYHQQLKRNPKKFYVWPKVKLTDEQRKEQRAQRQAEREEQAQQQAQRPESTIVEPVIDVHNMADRDFVNDKTITFWDQRQGKFRTLTHEAYQAEFKTAETLRPRRTPETTEDNSGLWDEVRIGEAYDEVASEAAKPETTDEATEVADPATETEPDAGDAVLYTHHEARNGSNKAIRERRLRTDYARAVNGGSVDDFLKSLISHVKATIQLASTWGYTQSTELAETADDWTSEIALKLWQTLKHTKVDNIVNYVNTAILNHRKGKVNKMVDIERTKWDIHNAYGEAVLNDLRGTGGGRRVGTSSAEQYDDGHYSNADDTEDELRYVGRTIPYVPNDEKKTKDEKWVTKKAFNARRQQLDQYIRGQRTGRDRRILKLLRDGKSNEQISKELNIGTATAYRVKAKMMKSLREGGAGN